MNKYQTPPSTRKTSHDNMDYSSYGYEPHLELILSIDVPTGTTYYVTVPKKFERFNAALGWESTERPGTFRRTITFTFFFDGDNPLSSTDKEGGSEENYFSFTETLEAKHYYFHTYLATYPEFSDDYVGLDIFDLILNEKTLQTQ